MTKLLRLIPLGLASLAFAACTTTGNVEKNAAGGAAAGAAVGAGIGAISGDVKTGEGAIAGAVVGGLVGALRGNKKDQQINGGTLQRPNLDKNTRYYDDQTNRYYYYEKGTSRTFYENFELRSQG